MYVPAHFKPDDEAVRDLLRHPGAANLITATTDGLMATMRALGRGTDDVARSQH